jgi:hypothetical protein
MQGLEEMVEIVKTPTAAYALRADGAELSLPALRRLNNQAHRERFGPFIRGYAEHLAGKSAADTAAVAIYYRPELDWGAFSKRLYSTDAKVVAGARAELQEVIARDGAELKAQIEALGLTVTSVGNTMPALFATGTISRIRKLATIDRVRTVMSNEALQPEHRAHENVTPDAACGLLGAHDSVQFHKIDAVFNHQHIYGLTKWGSEEGDRQRIGIFEDAGDNILYEAHEALSGALVEYSNLAPSGGPYLHATQVASVISSSHDGQLRGAGNAHFFYPNSGVYTNFPSFGWVTASICQTEATSAAYHWMHEERVRTVNESYGCLHGSINCFAYEWAQVREGVTQDWYSRLNGMTIVKAAGNKFECQFELDGIDACPWTLNSICVGSVNSEKDVSCGSAVVNPGTFGPGPRSDREEPDLMALGGEHGANCSIPNGDPVCVAGFDQSPPTNSQLWVGAVGTSLAAPAVTSMIALFREMCEPRWEWEFSPVWLRAVTRTASWGHNPAHYAYSTPVPPDKNKDWMDGAGVLFADALVEFCEPGADPHVGSGSILIDLVNHGDDGMPDGSAEYQDEYDWDPPGQTRSQPMAYDYTPPLASRRSLVLQEWGGLPAGTRIRATWSWYGCGAEEPAEAPVSIATDFDLFLFNATYQKYIWASQSIDDNNEGFDFTLQDGQDGDIQLIVAWPNEEPQTCEGAELEPGAWAWRIWVP